MKRQILAIVCLALVGLFIASTMVAASTATWSLYSQGTIPPAGRVWAYTKEAVPNRDDCANDPGWQGNDRCQTLYVATTHRVYMWSETGSQMYAMDATGTQWIAMNPTSPAGAPSAREGACLAWSGQTSSDNGHMWGEQTLVLFGGWTGTAYTNEVNIYNIVNNTWEFKSTTLNPSPIGRYYHQCARFSSSGGGTYEYNGIVMFGGYNYMNGGTLNDIWVFCDHAGTNPYENDLNGCGANIRKWVQFSWKPVEVGSPSCGSIYTPTLSVLSRQSAAVTELHARVQPYSNHGFDDEFVVWGGKRGTTILRDGAYVRWESNTGGLTVFSCQVFSDNDGGTGIPVPLSYPGAGYRSHGTPGILGLVIFGGYTALNTTTKNVWIMNWELSTSRIYYYLSAPSGSTPKIRYNSAFPCHYDEYPAFPGGCATPTTYMMFGGEDGTTLYSDTRGAYLT